MTILEDDYVEGEERLVITITETSSLADVSGITSTTIIINDDNGKFICNIFKLKQSHMLLYMPSSSPIHAYTCTFTVATVSFSPAEITVTESSSVDARVCVKLTSISFTSGVGELKCDIDITLSPTGDTAGI